MTLLDQASPAGGGQGDDVAANGADAAAGHAVPAADAEGAGAMETEERGAWRDYTHACLRSFVRRYNVQVGRSVHVAPAERSCGCGGLWAGRE